MPQRDERLRADPLGIEIVLRPSGAPEEPGALTYDVFGRPRGFIVAPHVHPDQTERYEVISGQMRLTLGGRRRMLNPGDRAETPAGANHRQLPGGSGPGHVRVTLRPAGDTEAFIRRLVAMCEQGQFNRMGFPRPVAGARLTLDFADAGHASFPPLQVQRALARALLALAALGSRRYEFVDEWDVAAPPEVVYEALSDSRTYPSWWRPVYVGVESDGPPAVGGVSRQHFKGRLPYHLHTRTTITRLEPPFLIEGEVDGDLRGLGTWRLTPTPPGTHVRFEWTVYADRRLLRVLTPLLRPLLRANHAWAIARAIEGLEPFAQAQAQALARAGASRMTAGGPPTETAMTASPA